MLPIHVALSAYFQLVTSSQAQHRYMNAVFTSIVELGIFRLIKYVKHTHLWYQEPLNTPDMLQGSGNQEYSL